MACSSAEQRGELLGRIEMLTEWLANQFPEFGDDDAARLREMSNEGVFEVRSALKAQQSWAAIRKLLRSRRLKAPGATRAK